MAKGDVIGEVFNANGERTGTVVYNEGKGTVREFSKTGRTAQTTEKMGAANYNNPNNNPNLKAQQMATGRRTR